MPFLRTPEECFANLPNYPFKPNYLEVDGLRMHYVDENPSGEEVVLMLHGEPSWSFLYRKMIPVFAKAGFRAIAPDLIGFGKSDKPTEMSDYSYQGHVDWVTAFIERLDLKNVTLFCQDWGGLIGLRIVAAQPERFSRIVAANTFLSTGGIPMPEAFLQWQQFAKDVPEFNVGKVIKKAVVTPLTEEIQAAYDAPFPDESYKAGARIFPALVPTSLEDPASAANLKAWEVLGQWKKPFLTLFSDKDPITRGGDRAFQSMVPGTKGLKHETIVDAGHFLQEDKGEIIAEKVVAFIIEH